MELVALALLGIAAYWLRTLVMALGAWRERSLAQPICSDDQPLPLVSIVIPARNEEHRIGRCLESLTQLDYPPELLEIIIVNDRSTDRTADVIASYQSHLPSMRVITLTAERSGNLRGKAGALDAGINAARGSILLLTDADCAVHPQWVRAHVAQYTDPDVAMVCAYTLIDEPSFFARYQAVEWNTTNTLASAGVYYRHYLGCFGNNMSLRKEVYHAIGGYGAIPFSVTEDLALLQAVGSRGHRIRYLCSVESTIDTEPCRTLDEYLHQHRRWLQGAWALGWRAYLFSAVTAVYWLGVLSALLTGVEWLIALAVATRLCTDAVLNIPTLLHLRRTKLLWWIVPTSFLLGLLELSLPLLALSRSIHWKGQIFVTSPSRAGAVVK